jgi:hypothetical protein
VGREADFAPGIMDNHAISFGLGTYRGYLFTPDGIYAKRRTVATVNCLRYQSSLLVVTKRTLCRFIESTPAKLTGQNNITRSSTKEILEEVIQIPTETM